MCSVAHSRRVFPLFPEYVKTETHGSFRHFYECFLKLLGTLCILKRPSHTCRPEHWPWELAYWSRDPWSSPIILSLQLHFIWYKEHVVFFCLSQYIRTNNTHDLMRILKSLLERQRQRQRAWRTSRPPVHSSKCLQERAGAHPRSQERTHLGSLGRNPAVWDVPWCLSQGVHLPEAVVSQGLPCGMWNPHPPLLCVLDIRIKKE